MTSVRVIATTVEAVFSNQEIEIDRTPDSARISKRDRNIRQNKISCLGACGELFYKICVEHLGKYSDIANSTGLSYKQLSAMKWGDVSNYSMADIQFATQNLYWVLLFAVDDVKFDIIFDVSGKKTYRFSDFWNSDAEEIKKARKAISDETRQKMYSPRSKNNCKY